MRSGRIALALIVAAFAGNAGAQTINLRDLLTDFLRQGITLAPPPAGFSHSAHFIGADSPQFQALGQFNTDLAAQLSSFPLASSAGGFTYKFDPALGILTRTTDSFGPIYAERADTIGSGKFNVGLNYNHSSFTQVDNLPLRDGALALVFQHIDVNGDNEHFEPFYEGDVITAQLFLKIQTDITAFSLSYGLSDRVDVGVAIPVVKVDIEARSDAVVQRIATGNTPFVNLHQFVNGTAQESFSQSGSASGLGDIVLRGKFQAVRGGSGGLAFAVDVRVPTGEERDLLGTGATQVKGMVIGSLRLGTLSPHLNAGYTWSDKPRGGGTIPDEIDATAGFDLALHPRLTFAVDVLGRDFRNGTRVRVVNTQFVANTETDATKPLNLVTATFPRLTVESVANLNTLLGSVGFKFNPVANLLLSVNGLFSLNHNGLQARFTPLVALDYGF
jgi:hypothetical protein